MKSMPYTLLTSFILFTASSAIAGPDASFLEKANVKQLTTEDKSIYPETLIYSKGAGHFYVGSVRYGTVYEIDDSGAYKQIIKDEKLHSVLGIAVDYQRQRLFVTNSDLGVATNSEYDGSLKVAGLGIYDLTSGSKIAYHDLASLLPKRAHFANGITLDSEGNAYITDSVAPVIYKVDTENNASVFLQSPEFEGDGFNLNGIVYHPDGYLIAIKKNSGDLFKIPLEEPQAFSTIEIGDRFVGGDGLIIIDDDELVVISNEEAGVSANAAYLLKGMDHWQSAKLTSTLPLGDVYPTTGAVKDQKIHVIHSSLKLLRQSAEQDREKLGLVAAILEIGTIKDKQSETAHIQN